ncbi:hypothetical protein MNBD_BACTEROID06-1236, partial [hydrothermal vent metagenome]
MNQIKEQSKLGQFEETKFVINYKRVWYRVLRYWYFVLTSVFIALLLAFLYNRYAPKKYAISASIIIKESEEAGQSAEIL